jgi:ligand-binding SRPBCC domain-containing protein
VGHRRYAARVATSIEVVTLVGAAPATVFDLELDVDVHAESLSGSGETSATSTGRRRLALGDEVTFRARHLGLRWRMTSRVSAYDRPVRFVDEQTRGPFRAMRHEHLFDDLGDGRTRMTDRMTVRAPLGPLGAVVTRLLLAPYLKRLLTRRAAHIKRVAEKID